MSPGARFCGPEGAPRGHALKSEKLAETLPKLSVQISWQYVKAGESRSSRRKWIEGQNEPR
jgi:hypothetical protein